MCCKCCSVTQRKAWVFGLGTIFLVLGITMIFVWPNLSTTLMHNDLVLKEGSESYRNWVEAPIPIYLEFTMFNWTNPEEIRNPNVKPNFVEMGPYVFLEKHLKQNISFHGNDTVSYLEKKTWFFDSQRSKGTLEDMLTTAHVITASVADEMRNKSKFIKKIVNFMLNREGGHLYVTKSVREWIFDGYQDDLTDFLHLFNTSKIDIPYTKFGWMVDRNGSAEYDGSFTIYTGVGDISKLGQLNHWNGKSNSGFYDPPCDTINGTTGDVFPPHMDPKQELTIYATDTCRYMNFKPNGTFELYGLEAINWVGTTETLDSGENFPSQRCFCNPEHTECPKTGVVDCKKCRDNAPIYASFPHFYLADPSYANAISGMKPDPKKHTFQLAVEPYTGIPLQVNARLQINMMIEPDDVYDIYRGIPKVLMPMFWFEQKVTLDETLASQAKLAINLEDYGRYSAIALISLGAIMILIGIILTVTKRWTRTPIPDDEDMLTN